MDDVLLYLLKRGAASNPVKVTTNEIGDALNMTQQNASRRLNIMINAGRVSRSGDNLIITKEGLLELRGLYSDLRAAFEGISKITGQLTDGIREGKYYLSLPGYKNGIKEKFALLPYPGTLNIRLGKDELWKKDVLFDNALVIPGFRHSGRTFGELSVKSCRIKNLPAVAILPERTHHPYEILELVSDRSLRKALKIKSGDTVSVTL